RKDTADAAELSYSLAGLLLTTDGENGYFFFRNDEAEYSAFYDSPLYDNRLGRPLAAADLASDTPTYQRAFDCGSVQLAVSTVTTQPLGAADSTITYDPSCANTVTQAEISGFTAAPTFSAVSGQYAPEMRDMATGFFDAGATLDALMLTGDYDGFHIAFMAGAGNGQLNEVGRFTYDAMNQYGTYYTDPPSGLAVADLSNDGKQDFAVGFSLQPRVDVFYGDGAFGFAGPTSLALPAGFVPQTISLSDLNGDGRKDVIVGSSNAGASGPISIFLATGATSFGPRTQLTVPGSAFSAIAAAADVNADGKQDLLYANAGQVGYALGNGDGTFAAFASASPGTRARDKLRVADLNYDGYVDLLVSAQDGMQFFAGSASGPVLTAPPSEQGRGIRAALGDFNRDGSLDIVSTDGGATIRLNHGNATFASSALPYPGWAEFAETGDFNGDGKADIVQTTRFYFYVYLNTTP
ncbi:MAG TPA: VCBS repeat-containing protein, partial [Herpetosiphonaceae bacterium]